MSELNKIKIFLVEDHEITRVGLKLTLDQIDDFEVVGEAADGQSALDLVLKAKPDVVLMDIGLPLLDGINAAKQIKDSCPETRVIMLTSHEGDRDIFAALGAGADGYCLKEVSSTRLAMAIRAVSDGAAWLDPIIANRVMKACAQVTTSLRSTETIGKTYDSSLSQREIDVLRLVVDGMSNQEIAGRLSLSVETIKTHMRHIMEKLAVDDRTQAAVKALREGLI
jgi:DNA-binding NarL/FixJ family response regulator